MNRFVSTLSALAARPWAPFLFLLVVVYILFAPFLFPGTHWVLSIEGTDLSGQFLSWREFGFSELAQGRLPLWNPHLFCGEPFFGGFQSALLYPLNWIFLFLPLAFAVNLSIALHVFLSGVFSYLWIRARGASVPAGLLVAFLYMFGGATFLHLVPGHLPNLCTMAWIPLVFLAVDRWRDQRSLRWVLAGQGAIAMAILAGHIQYVYYTGIALMFLVLLDLPRTSNRSRFLLGLAAMGLGAALLTAIQLGAGWDAGRESFRAQALDMGIVDQADFTWERLWCLFMPNFFSGWRDYWGGGSYWEGALYISLTAWVLALWGLKVSTAPRKKSVAWTALILTLIGLGRRSFVFVFFFHYFPLFNHFRGVGKFNCLITLCLGALAALGLDEALQKDRSLRGLAKLTGWGAGVFTLVALVFYITPRVGGGRLFRQFLSHADAMAWAILLAALLLGLLSLLAHFSARDDRWRYGFMLLAFLELFIFARENRPSFDIDPWLRKQADLTTLAQKEPGDYRVLAESNNASLGTPALDIWGEDPAVPWRYARFAVGSQGRDPQEGALDKALFRRIVPALGVTRWRYRVRWEGDKVEFQRTQLKESPRFSWSTTYQRVKPGDVLAKTLDPKFDPERMTFFEEDPGFPSARSSKPASVTARDLDSDRIEVTVEAAQPGALVVSDNYAQGWKAEGLSSSVQGEYPVLPANGFERAVILPAGHHHFLLEYRPTAFEAGKWISIVAWVFFLPALLFLCLFAPERRGL